MPAKETEEDFSHEEGGPTKSFLEHLEDLRWVLMKCVAAVAVTFMACLLGSPVLVKVLTYPLKKANIHSSQQGAVTLSIGTNRVGTLMLDTNQPNFFGTNRTMEIVPVQIGTNLLLSMQPSTNPSPFVSATGGINLVNLGPASAFMLAFSMAIYGGIALASPFLLYFIGQFVFPALRLKEKKYSFIGLGFGVGLFALGITFCYFFLMPVALKAAVQYSEWMGFQAETWRAEEYINFVSKFLLGMGLGFEMPVVLLVLVKIGVLDYQKLAAFRRYMIVVCLLLGAVLTTPEVITQVLMAVPLYILYEISIWIAWYWERKERKREGTISV
jgi:sec-independent protein translocase protein TatC